MTPARGGRAVARRLIRLLPPGFRTEFGSAIEAVFLDRWAESRGQLGGFRHRLALVGDLCLTIAREHRAETRIGAHPMQNLWLDLKHTVRWLARSPGFAVAALLTLALGIGATTAMFSLVDGVLLRPLPFAEPDRLAFITREGDVSLPDGEDWRSRSRTFQSIGLFARAWKFDLTGLGEPEPVTAHAVEPGFFDVLGVKPTRGRLFGAPENRPSGAHLIVITEGFWARRFNRDPAAIGRTLTLSGNPATIIGVLPREADFLADGVIGFVPISVELPWAPANRGTNNLDAIGRIRPGVPFARARAELTGISRQLSTELPETNRGKIVDPMPMTEYLVGRVSASLWLVLAAVATLLAIAAVNLAGLLLARAAARQPELALRTALGAGRGRLIAQLVTEGVAIALAGGILGIGTALVTHRLLLSALPDAVPRTAGLAIRWPVILFGAGASMLVGLLCGLIPAWQVSRTGPAAALGGKGSAGASRQRGLRTIVAVEVALAMALLVGAGLLAKSFRRLWSEPLGFEPSGVLMAELVLPESRYNTRLPQTQAFTRIIDRLKTIPGVREASFVTTGPLFARGGIGTKILFDGRPDIRPDQRTGARVRFTYGDYFATLRIPVTKGRALGAGDDDRAPAVAVINATFAKAFFAGRDPIGQRIALKSWDDDTKTDFWATIVGVAGDIKGTSLAEGDEPAVYIPYVQRKIWWERFGVLGLRTEGDPAALTAALKEAVWSVDPLLTIDGIQSLGARRSAAAGRERFLAVVIGLFAILALALVVQGLWSIVAYAVEARRREFGVRMALGAKPGSVVVLALRQAVLPTGVGAVAGVALALAVTRLLRGMLFQVSPTDPGILAAAGVALPLIALAAAAVPAWRATRIDPLTAIRAE